MNTAPKMTITIAAKSDAEFEALLHRARDLVALPPLCFERTVDGQRVRYMSNVLSGLMADEQALLMTLDFDPLVYEMLGVDLSGRDALTAAESAVLH